MARHEQGPDLETHRNDLNLHDRGGHSSGPGPEPTRSAYDLKEAHDRLREMPDDVLKQIPILEPGIQLNEGAVYFDLRHPERGEFKGMNNMEADADNWYIAKDDVDYELWN